MLNVSKMATELSVAQWWKSPNWKEDEEKRKAKRSPDNLWAALPNWKNSSSTHFVDFRHGVTELEMPELERVGLLFT
jgi:hypothetical protein